MDRESKRAEIDALIARCKHCKRDTPIVNPMIRITRSGHTLHGVCGACGGKTWRRVTDKEAQAFIDAAQSELFSEGGWTVTSPLVRR